MESSVSIQVRPLPGESRIGKGKWRHVKGMINGLQPGATVRLVFNSRDHQRSVYASLLNYFWYWKTDWRAGEKIYMIDVVRLNDTPDLIVIRH